MGRVIKVDSDQLDDVAAQMTIALDEIEKVLDALEGQVLRLRGEWTGEASQAYDRAHRDWDSSLRELEGVARAVTAIAKSGSTKFRALNAANAAVWPS